MPRKRQYSKDDVLKTIHQWFLAHGAAPTVEELRRALNVGSTRTVLRYLEWLEEAGDIERWRGARGLRLLKSPGGGVETREVPLVGEVAAGPLMLAEQNIEGWVRVPKEFVRGGSKHFFLRVHGDSMNKASVPGGVIEDGDLVLVRQQSVTEPGERVVVVLDGEATIKRLVAGRGYWVLRPESSNPKHRPVLVDRDFRIQGVVTRVFKKGSKVI